MKVLVIRFSSIGDVTQALSIAAHICSQYPEAEVHFLTKSEFQPLMEGNPHIKKIWTIAPKSNFSDLKSLSHKLNQEHYTHLYDAHNNTRSNFIFYSVKADHKLQRSMSRLKRFLLIYLKINLFDKPLSGQRDLLKPLEKWNIQFKLPPAPQLFLNEEYMNEALHILRKYNIPDNYITIAPSSAHELKRWPIAMWKKLISLSPEEHFVVLAGPKDYFTSGLNEFKNVTNLTGLTSLQTSAALVQKSKLLIANDTGLLHFAEQLGKRTIALMGPAPFGFPSRIDTTTTVLKKDLPCWPCSKHGQGPCTNTNFQQCMRDISPEEVKKAMNS